MSALMPPSVMFETRGTIAYVTLNRPERRNGLTPEMLREVYETLLRADDDKNLSVLVVQGAGQNFCVGADLNNMTARLAAGKAGQPDVLWFNVSLLLHQMRPVTIAAINGGCAGAGLGWALACDLRIASTTSRFNSAFLDAGAPGDMAAIWFAGRLLGGAAARALFFNPEKFDAETALRMGLVQSVYSLEDFTPELDALVQRLANRPAAVLAAMKANFLDAERLPLKDYIVVETDRHLALMRARASGPTVQTPVDHASTGSVK